MTPKVKLFKIVKIINRTVNTVNSDSRENENFAS